MSVVETGKRLNKHVNAFVTIFISSRTEHVKSIFEVEIKVSVEVTANKFVDLGF